MGTKKVIPGGSPTLEVYERLISSNGAIERKGKTIPYTSLNGNMFSLFGKDGSLGFRLSAKDREEFLTSYPSAVLVQYGIVMKEYVRIPEELLTNWKLLKKYFDRSYEYAKSLKRKGVSKKAGK